MKTTNSDLREALRRTRRPEIRLSDDFADRLVRAARRRRQSFVRRIAAVLIGLLLISGLTYATVRIGGGGRLPWLEQREMPCPPSELEVLPEFPGGTDALMQYWMKHLHYPESALADSIEGRVIVSFIVEKDGRLTGLRVERSVRADLDSAALSVVRDMPRWMPGYSKGRAVRSKYVIPICYRLDKGAGAPIGNVSIRNRSSKALKGPQNTGRGEAPANVGGSNKP